MADLFLCCGRRRYIFALRPDVLYFLHAAAWRRKYSNPYAEFEGGGFCRRGLDTLILNFKVAVSAGSDFMLLLCIRVYCIFPTLPLDVENTVIHAQSLKVAVSVGTGLIILFCVRMYCIFSTLPLNVENTAHPYAEFECDGFLCFREIERKAKKVIALFLQLWYYVVGWQYTVHNTKNPEAPFFGVFLFLIVSRKA